MNILPRRRSPEVVPEQIVPSEPAGPSAPKGRPTPKRRDSSPRRAPVTAPPQNRREAMNWQREQAKAAKAAGRTSSGAPARGTAEYREAVRRGDPASLPKRDRGDVRKLARDWVDSRRMLSNFMLILFPLMLIGFQVRYINIVVLALFVVIVGEWFIAGRRILAIAKGRGLQTKETPITIGFYAGSRSYLPRKWRLPQPQKQLGEIVDGEAALKQS